MYICVYINKINTCNTMCYIVTLCNYVQAGRRWKNAYRNNKIQSQSYKPGHKVWETAKRARVTI